MSSDDRFMATMLMPMENPKNSSKIYEVANSVFMVKFMPMKDAIKFTDIQLGATTHNHLSTYTSFKVAHLKFKMTIIKMGPLSLTLIA